MQMLVRKDVKTQKMHVMCTTLGGVFQTARINGVDFTFDPPRVCQIPEEDEPIPTP
jgi:hypothetical protein